MTHKKIIRIEVIMFTESDSLHEIIIKVMLAEAYMESGEITDKHLEIIQEWIKYMKVEGPEYDRIKSMFSKKIDYIQAEIFYNQLHAALSNEKNRKEIISILQTFLQGRKKIFPIEEKLQDRITKILNDRSLTERLKEQN
ncbi:MAG: hypothetical protein OEZ34_09525 [Spirochaetia bacterium]|nr:hypothetical protein [Spirochaetia bacterium]